LNIIAGNDEAVAQWVGAQMGVRFQEPYTAFGFSNSDGIIDGAVVFNDYYPGGNIEVTYFGPHSFRKGSLQFMARFCFDKLEATRVTAKTRRSNVIMRKILPKGGFVFEGTQKRYFGPTKADDALLFVMHREHAERWLKR